MRVGDGLAPPEGHPILGSSVRAEGMLVASPRPLTGDIELVSCDGAAVTAS